MFKSIQQFLAGRKTYILALSAIATALEGVASGKITVETGMMAIFLALSQMSQRAAMNK